MILEFRDKTIRCRDCGDVFLFEASEAYYFATRTPPLAEPKRCPACRRRKRQAIGQGHIIERTPATADPRGGW